MLMLQVSAKSILDDSEGQINGKFVAIKMSETQLKINPVFSATWYIHGCHRVADVKIE